MHKSPWQLINKFHFALDVSTAVPTKEDGGDKLINALRTRHHHRARELLTQAKAPKLEALQRLPRKHKSVEGGTRSAAKRNLEYP